MPCLQQLCAGAVASKPWNLIRLCAWLDDEGGGKEKVVDETSVMTWLLMNEVDRLKWPELHSNLTNAGPASFFIKAWGLQNLVFLGERRRES